MKMGYVLVALGVLLIIVGIMVTRKSSSETGVTPAYTPVETINNSEEIVQEKVENTLTESEQKGQDFEKYVVSKFPEKYYSITEWRGDKYSNGRYAESNTYPDLELALKYKGEKIPFAVECKWRARFDANGYLQWSDEEQIQRYNDFAKERNIPVFVILGVGGTPSEPKSVYCVPLRAMKYERTNKDYLEDFKHDMNRDLYYHYKEEKLD